MLDWLEAYEGGRWYPYFAFLAFTGTRAGEVLRLRRADLDREQCEVTFWWHKTGAKGGRSASRCSRPDRSWCV